MTFSVTGREKRITTLSVSSNGALPNVDPEVKEYFPISETCGSDPIGKPIPAPARAYGRKLAEPPMPILSTPLVVS
jgi:hypothetical protein